MSTIAFQSSGVPATATILGFWGREGISDDYAFEIYLVLPAADCPSDTFEDALGSRATLTVGGEDDRTYDYRGLLAAAEVLEVVEGNAYLHLTMTPRLSLLHETCHSRIFTQSSVVDVLRATFEDGGMSGDEVSFALSAAYSVEEHICQYKESHHHFAARWMQREGIYFYFDHHADPPVLTLVDDLAAASDCEPARVRYSPVTGEDISARTSLRRFRRRRAMVSQSVRVVDYDYASPGVDVSAQQLVADDGQGARVLYGGRLFTPAEATRLARIRGEEIGCDREVYTASGPAYGLRPGFVFELWDHPDPAENQRYLVTVAHHSGCHQADPNLNRLAGRAIPSGYHVEITCIPASVQYRKTSDVAWPRIAGFEHARVDGPGDDDYAQLDEQGRYLVKMHFDEGPGRNGTASTRLRMMQPHGGKPEGFHFPLRKGTEVFVAFLGGDPDRPFLSGSVPNAVNPSPVVRANQTQDIVETGGRTRILCEDTAGRQRIVIFTPTAETYLHLGVPFAPATHYITAHTKGDCLFDIGGQQDIDVGGKLTETVQAAVDEDYATSQTSTITGPQRTTVHAPVIELYQATQHTHVSGLRLETFDGGQTTLLTGLRDETYEVGLSSTVVGPMTEVNGGALTRTVTGTTNETWNGPLTTCVAANETEIYPVGVEQKYGATVGAWGKNFTWISGNIDITAPSFVVMKPSELVFKAINDPPYFQAFKHSSGNLSNTMTGLAYSGFVLSGSATGASFNLNAIKLSVAGYSNSTSFLCLEVGIIHVNVAALIVHLG